MTKRAKVAKRPPWYVFAAAWTAFIAVGLVGWAMYGYYHRAPEVEAVVPTVVANLCIPDGSHFTAIGSISAVTPNLIEAAAQARPAPVCPTPPKQIHHPISHRAPSIVRSPVWYLHNPQVWE